MSGSANGVSRRNFLIGAAMAGASGLALSRMPQAVAKPLAKDRLETLVPKSVGGWSFESTDGVILPPPDALSDRLYDSLLTRRYDAKGEPPIMLLIAYNNVQDGVLQVHRPEVCYPAGGYRLTPTAPTPLPNGRGGAIGGNQFTALNAERTEHVLYFTRVGQVFPQRWREQRMAVIRANLDGYVPDGLLYRVSVLGNDPDQSFAALRRFVATMLRDATPDLRALLLGTRT